MSAANFDAQRENLWQAWLSLQAQIDEAFKKGAAHYFTCIRQVVCDAFALEALSSARLGQSDETVFNHLARLMEIYREVISLFSGPIRDISPDLVVGLCDILCSRLRQFEDDTAGSGNPVAREKYAILEKAIVNTAQQVEILEKSYISEHPWSVDANCIHASNEGEPQEESAAHPCIDPRKELLLGNTAIAWQSLFESIVEQSLPSLHVHYIQNLQTCLSNIDDLHTRKTASYYTDLLEREWEVLGLIIQVQVKAIETAFETTCEAIGNVSGHSLHAILSKLREAYQHTGLIVSGLRKMMQTVNPLHPVTGSTYEDFAQTLAAGTITPPNVKIDDQAFIAALLPKADELFEDIRTHHLELINNLQLTTLSDISLAKDVVNAFEKAREGLMLIKEETTINAPELETVNKTEIPYELMTTETKVAPFIAESPCTAQEAPDQTITNAITNNPQGSPEPPTHHIEDEIMSGIAETIEIKIESLNESLQLFSDNNINLFASLSTGLPVLTKEDLIASAGHMQAAWCANPPAEETISDFIADSISLDAFATYGEQLTKQFTNISTKIEKASLRFKKETLLYEISTYEEILYHSVSRLRESNLPQVAAAVCLLDGTFADLESLLTGNGIAVIRPAVHDPFNGREHEVLVAEEAEGFTKGEIIKVMTSGYKYNDQVILRANVIAAK